MQLLPSSFPASSLRQICPSGDSTGLQRETGRHMSCGAVATARGGVVRRVNDATISLGAYRVLIEAPQDRCCIFSGLRQLVRSETGFYHQEEIIKTHLSLSCLSKKLLNQNHDAAGGMQEGGWRKCLWVKQNILGSPWIVGSLHHAIDLAAFLVIESRAFPFL